jgi:hypothetical protein
MLLVGAGLSTFRRRMRKLRAHGVHIYSQLVEREEEVCMEEDVSTWG